MADIPDAGMRAPLVVVIGNLGAGKTTFATRLSQHFGWWLGLESVKDNPYLADFYTDMARWSFHLQVYFLGNRVDLHRIGATAIRGAVLDRSVYEDRHIFACALHQQEFLKERDYQSYVRVYDHAIRDLREPDLFLYLKAPLSVLRSRIQQRNQECDRDISEEYLGIIEGRYDAWVPTLPLGRVMEIDTTTYDPSAPTWESAGTKLFSQIQNMLECA